MAAAKEDPRELIYPLSLTKTNVWIGLDQTPIPPGVYGRLIEIKGKDGSITLQRVQGGRVALPKDELTTYADQSLIAIKTQGDKGDKRVTETDIPNWKPFKAVVHTSESPYIPQPKTEKPFHSDNLPGETPDVTLKLPEISVTTALRLRRSGVQTLVVQNSGKKIPYQTTALLSMVINRTLDRLTLVDTTDNNPIFHTRDNSKIEQITTVSRDIKNPPTS